MNEKELEAKLILAMASEEEIKEAQAQPEEKVVEAAVLLGLEMSLYKDGEVKREVVEPLDYDVPWAVSLPADFQRPVITPEDLPEEMRKRLEEGLRGNNMTDLEREVMAYFRGRGLVDIQICKEGYGPCVELVQFVSDTPQFRLRKEKTYREPGELAPYQDETTLDSDVSLRDYFAGHALAGMLASPVLKRGVLNETFASDSYALSDAMIKEREMKK